MRRALVFMWVGLVLPFVLTMVNGGPDGWLPHVMFHPIYVAFLSFGVVGALQLRSASSSRALRGLAAVTVGAAVLCAAGQTAELIAVLRHGGWSADASVFEETLHLVGANLTVPMVALLIVLTLATTVVVHLVTTGRRVGPTLSRAFRTTHRWASVLFVLTLPVALAFNSSAWVTAPTVALLLIMLATGVQMSCHHYLTRWRRRTRRDVSGAAGEPRRQATAPATMSAQGADA